MDPDIGKVFEWARISREQHDVFTPMVAYQPSDGEPIVAFVGTTGPPVTLVAAIAGALSVISAEHGPAEWIAVAADTYARATDSPQLHPSLAEAFAAGDPAVVEQIVVQLVARAAPTTAGRQVYRYHAVDGYEWDPWETTPDLDLDLNALLVGALGALETY